MWTYILAAIVGAIPLYLYSKSRPRNFPPGPFNWPLVHNLLYLSFDGKFRQSMGTLHSKYGQLLSLTFGFGIWDVFVQGPDLVREVLNDSRFNGRHLYSYFTLMNFDNSISLGQGEQWKRRKKIFVQVMKDLGVGKSVFATGIEAEVQRLLNYLDERDGQLVDIKVGVCSIIN